MSEQTLVTDSTLIADRYGNFGVRDIDEITDPAFQFVEIIGEGGCGKTSLLRDHPGALIFNADTHPSPRPFPGAPAPKAAFFPVKDAKGRLIILDSSGKHKTVPKITWQLFLDEQTRIFQAVDAGNPHPATVVIDTVAPMIPLVRKYILDTKPRFKNYATFDDVPDGNPSIALWGGAYDAFALFMAEFLQRGIGVYVIGHRITRILKGPDGDRLIVTNNIPEAVRSRYYPALDMLLEMQMRNVAFKSEDGSAKFRRERILTEPPSDAREKFRVRTQLPLPFQVPNLNAWDAFRQLCLDSA